MSDAEWEWEVAYWRHLAVTKSWFPWWFGWHGSRPIFMGDDEYQRRTIVIGPICFPLWRCRCHYCRTDLAVIRGTLENEEPLA